MISKDNCYFKDRYQGVPLDGFTSMFRRMLNHRNIEVRLEYRFGRLPYRTLNFKFEHYDSDSFLGHSVVNYTMSEDFTRITEFKYYNMDEVALKAMDLAESIMYQ